MPITDNIKKAILEDAMLIFGTYIFVHNSVFYSTFMLRCFRVGKGFLHVSLLFFQYSPQVSREVTLMPHNLPTHLVKGQIWFATFFFVSGESFWYYAHYTPD